DGEGVQEHQDGQGSPQ
ncbi:hypothetical protein CFC21_064175, partial [Triticum aestivum]